MAETKKRTNPFTFFGQVRAEGRKVTWTSRQETVAATIMVLIMVVFASIFFLLTDWVVSAVVKLITGI
ncbi:preprotein translocase subunit SecE [Hirschia baltica]|uniref:Protein translocase subunit SecE n=1 Tax=Hirschia baltica (strain ATCC 49814 / DSM 5838 / IFAM 1418) TaxID=582402 RepID=C6XLI0_HIRBI|nr:preprotein translocase subunit SecE [Hirschia baltica]ACT59779.1 preprotein translocase, SecE subunit [Hirschia baltica ATCC 49814]